VLNTPVGGSSKQAKLFDRDVTWDKLVHRVTYARASQNPIQKSAKTALTDKQIGVLDIIPEVLPHFLLRRTLLVH
jgi:hypothetical protein